MFPRNEFNKAVCLQTILNELMHLVANDNDFLRETLANTIKVDDFTRRLYNIHERINNEGGPTQVSWFHSFLWFAWWKDSRFRGGFRCL